VSNVTFKPIPTTTTTYTANLPGSTAAAGGADTSSATTQSQTVYDSTGASHTVNYDWSYSSADTQGNATWALSTTVDGQASAGAQVTFNSSGQMSSIAQQTNVGTSPAVYGTADTTSGSTASFTIPASFNGTSQTMTVDLGTIGSSSGTTMATDASSSGSSGSATGDGVASGNYTGVAMKSDGSVMATFDNGQTQLVAKVPLATFANADGLLAVDGQAYTATSSSGAASINLAGQNGAGNLETSSVENSTTSLDTDLTKLITAQQAYGANAKVVTTANEMLQTVLSMKQ
jgi:flagellar hook protein FlgE